MPRLIPSVSLTCHNLAVDEVCGVGLLYLPGVAVSERAVACDIDLAVRSLVPAADRVDPKTEPETSAGIDLPKVSNTV